MLGCPGRRCREDRCAHHYREDAGWLQRSEEAAARLQLPSHALPACKRRKSSRGAPRQRPAKFVLLLTTMLVLVGPESRPASFVVPSPRTLRQGRIGFARRHAAAGEDEDASATNTAAPGPVKRSRLVQAWGVLGVACYLSYGVKKVVPIVRQGIGAITTPWQWGLFAATLGFFGYVEGYKGFQLGFCPRVVSRAWAVSEDFGGGGGSRSAKESAPMWHKALAPAFCIGYFHGTKARVISSWVVTSVIFLVVIGVRRLPNPYRAILDAGVIVGLMWGTISVLVLFAASLRSGKPPEYDPSLPKDTPYHFP